MRLLASVLVVLLAMITATGPAAGAGSRLAVMGNDARVVMTWSERVAFTIHHLTDGLLVAADHPFSTDIDTLAEALERDFATLTVDADRMTLRVQQRSAFVASATIVDDRTLAIEFAKISLPPLDLRIGEHPDFVRAVIEPIDPRRTSIERSGDRLNVDLRGKLATSDLERLAALPGITLAKVADGQLVLTLQPGTSVHDHIVGPDKQVLDIRRNAAGVEEGAVASSPSPTETEIALARHRPLARSPRPVGPDSPAATHELGDSEAANRTTHSDSSGAIAWKTRRFAELKVGSRAIDDNSIELTFEWPEPVPAAAFRRGAQLWLAFGAKAETIDADVPALIRIARRWISAMRAEPHVEATLLQLNLTDTAPAALRRDGTAWRLTLGSQALPMRVQTTDDRTGPFSVGPWQGDLIESSPEGVRLRRIDMMISMTDPLVGDRLGIGLALKEGAINAAEPGRFLGLRFLRTLQGAAWRELSEMNSVSEWPSARLTFGPPQGVAGRLEPQPNGFDGTILLTQPLSDDEPSPNGSRHARVLALNESGHRNGVAPPLTTASIRPSETDDSTIDANEHGKVEGNDSTIAEVISDEISKIGSAAPAEVGPLDLARHKVPPGMNFWSRRGELLQQLAEAEGAEREASRLAMARLLVAYGLGLEALALLGEQPAHQAGSVTVGGEPAAKPALIGAAQFLAGRFSAARLALDDPRLALDDETALWRAAALAAGEQWDDALEHWQRGRTFLEHYPASTQAALAEQGIMLLLNSGRGDDAFALIEHLAELRLDPAAADRVRALEAIALERDGAADEARAIWRRLARDGSPETRSRAILALVELDLASERINLDEAIAHLIDDRVHWRGQADEIMLERRLAALQRSAGQPEAALATLRTVIDREPKPEAVEIISSEMIGIFDEVFDTFIAGELDATSMLHLYRNYGELLNSDDGRVDELASALAELGLRDAAIGLLRDRLARRTSRDEDKARIGFELGRLLAQAGDTRGALAALVDSTPVDAVPENLATARRELMASLNDGMSAGQQTAAESGRAAIRQAFDRSEWGRVIEMALPLEAALGPGERHDAHASELVLMLAIAARAAGDDGLLDMLQRRYKEKLSNPDAAMLQLLAERPRFAGDAATILADAIDHTRITHGAMAELPAP